MISEKINLIEAVPGGSQKSVTKFIEAAREADNFG